MYGVCLELQHIDEQITDSYQKDTSIVINDHLCFFPKYVCYCILLLVDGIVHPKISPQLSSSERKAAAASVFLELQGLLKRLEPFQDGEQYENMWNICHGPSFLQMTTRLSGGVVMKIISITKTLEWNLLEVFPEIFANLKPDAVMLCDSFTRMSNLFPPTGGSQRSRVVAWHVPWPSMSWPWPETT